MAITDDDFRTQAAEYFEQALNDDNAEEPDEETVPESEEGEEEQSPEPPAASATPPPPADTITLPDGRIFNRQQAEEYLRFVDYLNANPEKAQAISRVLTGEVEPTRGGPSAPSPVQEYEETEPPDPRFQALQERLDRVEQLAATQAQTATQALINRARADYQTRHNLSDEEMNQVFSVGERLNVVASFLSGVDPVTGAPSNPDPLNAFERTFDLALNMLPDLQSKVSAHTREQEQKTKQRKRKLNSLAGGSSGSQRQSREPETAEERKAGMVQAIAQAMGVNE